LRESQGEDAIVAPTEGSEEATAASLTAANEPTDEAFDARLEGDFDGINRSRLPRYIKPVASQRSRRSWIYRYGYRVALLKDPSRIFFVCHYCHKHKVIDAGGGGIYETTRSTSTSQRHLEEQKRGHGYQPPGKAAVMAKESFLRRVLKDGKVNIMQTVANGFAGFSTQRFRLAAASWLVENNHPLSEFETPAFRRLVAAANPEAELALWASCMSVSRYVLRLYDFTRPRVVLELSQALSKIHFKLRRLDDKRWQAWLLRRRCALR
jgi:hypothetical protein